ncbi:MFS transporter [Agromyces sp. MMS24-K17]|uniref:MFS transporter n=1 Tax=Agromyces sp. MMS24-K17 TaxID=3372850 RepID=UPI0037546AD7
MRAKLLVLASAIGMLGWGGILPFQYAYAAETREWGALVAAAASSLFSVGALAAAPLAGRLSDRYDPVKVAVVAQLVAAAGAASLILANDPVTFLAGMLVFGLGLSGASPAKQVLALQWSSSEDRRRVFAYKFTGESLGMAAGAFLAGHLVDLDRPDGLTVGFAMAAAGFVLSSAIIALAGRGAPVPSEFGRAGDDPRDGAGRGAVRAIVADPALRWSAIVTIALALGFYAQFESGLPAYGITVLGVDPAAIGTAAAVNCIVIVALQVVMVRLTAKRSAPVLLMAVGAIWVIAWLGLSAAQVVDPVIASAVFVTAYGVFAVGETIYSPVLNPLVASLAPAGRVGGTLGTISALQTAFSAAGPLVAGVLLGAGLTGVFLGLHLGVSLVAVFAAWRVHRALAARGRRARAGATDRATAVEAPSADAAERRDSPPTEPIALGRLTDA